VHELKTPLTPLLVASELLVSKKKPKTLQKVTEVIYTGSRDLNERVDELLDLAKGEIGMLQIQPVRYDISCLSEKHPTTCRIVLN
jgi:signal transduction histidine kinase